MGLQLTPASEHIQNAALSSAILLTLGFILQCVGFIVGKPAYDLINHGPVVTDAPPVPVMAAVAVQPQFGTGGNGRDRSSDGH